MTGNRKKIYIAIIVICFATTGGVIYYGFFGAPSAPDTKPIMTLSDNNASSPAKDSPFQSDTQNGETVTFPAPSVFPNDTHFDWSLLESSSFKSLTSVPDLELGPVGRPNPFNP